MLASSNAKQYGVEFKPTSRVHLDNILEMLSDNILDNISKMLYRKGLVTGGGGHWCFFQGFLKSGEPTTPLKTCILKKLPFCPFEL